MIWKQLSVFGFFFPMQLNQNLFPVRRYGFLQTQWHLKCLVPIQLCGMFVICFARS